MGVFTAIDEYCARGGDGVEVRLAREHISYTKGQRSANIAFEYLIDDDALLIYQMAIRRWDPSGEIIASIERQGILRDLSAALAAIGVKHRFCA